MTEPRVSVVIPTWNCAHWVTEAVQSVLDQTFDGYEVIVVDDGSTDGTAEALEPWLDRIRYIRQDNAGQSAARNRGIRESRGEFVAFLDADDRWEPNHLESVLQTFEKHPEAGAVCAGDRDIDATGRITGRVHLKRTPGPFFTTAGMIARDTGIGCGRPPIARRSLLEEAGGYDETFRTAVDCEMWIRCSFLTTMVYMPDPLVLRRRHDHNLASNRGANARAWLRILQWLADTHPEFVRENRKVIRRALGKEHLRLGKGLLLAAGDDPGRRGEARTMLLRSIRAWPFFARAYTYLVLAWLPPAISAKLRRIKRR
jgi:glycosyltransferase involved in cell wall biosynthesis